MPKECSSVHMVISTHNVYKSTNLLVFCFLQEEVDIQITEDVRACTQLSLGVRLVKTFIVAQWLCMCLLPLKIETV